MPGVEGERPTRIETIDAAREKAIGLIGEIAVIGARSVASRLDVERSRPMRELERMVGGHAAYRLHSIPRTEWEKVEKGGIESAYSITRHALGRIVDRAQSNALTDYHARHPETAPKGPKTRREFGSSNDPKAEVGGLVARRTEAERAASGRAWKLIEGMSREGVRFFGRPASSPEMAELKGMTRDHDALTRSVRSLSRSDWRTVAEGRASLLPEATRLRLGAIAKDAAHTAGRALVEREVGPSPARSSMPTRGPDYIVGPSDDLSVVVAQASARGRSR